MVARKVIAVGRGAMCQKMRRKAMRGSDGRRKEKVRDEEIERRKNKNKSQEKKLIHYSSLFPGF